MKPINYNVWIEVEKTHNDTVMMGDKKLFLDTRFEPEFTARQYGIVYGVSDKIKDIKVGDKVHTHHFMATDMHRVKFIKDKLVYQVDKSMIYCTVRDGNINMLDNWVFVEQSMESEDDCKTDSGIWFKTNPDEIRYFGKLKYINSELKEQGAKVGDQIIFSENSEYHMDIEGQDLMRMRNEDVLAIYG